MVLYYTDILLFLLEVMVIQLNHHRGVFMTTEEYRGPGRGGRGLDNTLDVNNLYSQFQLLNSHSSRMCYHGKQC